VHLYEQELRSQLKLLADQVGEFDEGADLDRLEAEGLSVLIALAEFWRHFPEVSVRDR
jgi:hypothetical protein